MLLSSLVLLHLSFPAGCIIPATVSTQTDLAYQKCIHPDCRATFGIDETLTACPGWGLRHGAIEAQACARAIGGWITATGAVTNPRSASRSWFSGGALLRGGADLGAGFSLELEAGVDAPLLHRQFYTTTPLETVAETPPVSLLVGIGISRRL